MAEEDDEDEKAEEELELLPPVWAQAQLTDRAPGLSSHRKSTCPPQVLIHDALLSLQNGVSSTAAPVTDPTEASTNEASRADASTTLKLAMTAVSPRSRGLTNNTMPCMFKGQGPCAQ